jgi:lipid II:glycine glycyltransferase (peptidoglycan interpeptide bridge formation enzyme)
MPWQVFLWGKKEGYRMFDFGGAGKPDVAYGVRDYKKKFGGQVVNYGRFEKIHRPFLYRTVKAGFNVYQRIIP